ncbi:hypothetical protein KC333_g220 [Hortaea werneckii]|nr:hypothetical protein KC333_g220 [Hortaea werneckii]
MKDVCVVVSLRPQAHSLENTTRSRPFHTSVHATLRRLAAHSHHPNQMVNSSNDTINYLAILTDCLFHSSLHICHPSTPQCQDANIARLYAGTEPFHAIVTDSIAMHDLTPVRSGHDPEPGSQSASSDQTRLHNTDDSVVSLTLLHRDDGPASRGSGHDVIDVAFDGKRCRRRCSEAYDFDVRRERGLGHLHAVVRHGFGCIGVAQEHADFAMSIGSCRAIETGTRACTVRCGRSALFADGAQILASAKISPSGPVIHEPPMSEYLPSSMPHLAAETEKVAFM